jgi:hypothetical protein
MQYLVNSEQYLVRAVNHLLKFVCRALLNVYVE